MVIEFWHEELSAVGIDINKRSFQFWYDIQQWRLVYEREDYIDIQVGPFRYYYWRMG